jgi:cysteinyl-tRNA synthetase
MSLQLYNSLTRKKETFTPLKPGKVGMYVCGVTVYDYCHVGHARVMVVFDIINRWLQQLGYDVDYVRNFTDVDDKIIQRASERGIGIDVLTDEMIAAFHEDIDSLGCLQPRHEPRATAHMAEMITMIGALVEQGRAYVSGSGDVLYAVRSFDGYGQLSGKNIDELESGSRVEVDASKRDPLDFVLWKMAKPGEPAWGSPWGSGRPGWHIECSAMSCAHLGDTFDIHGGGMDLKFPHHENEIAQARAANGGGFAHYWLHNGFVNINAEKMSKSLGNFFTIREVTAKYHPEVLRMFMLGTHYRSPLDFSDSALDAAKAGLDRLYETARRIQREMRDVRCEMSDVRCRTDDSVISHLTSNIVPAFTESMNDDFNTPEALACLFDVSRSLNKGLDAGEDVSELVAQFAAMCGVLGIVQHDVESWFKGDNVDAERIEALISERAAAKKARDFARADAIRDELATEGIVLEDSPTGTTWKKV